MTLGTGKTIYETILSINSDNLPVTGVTFDSFMYKDGELYTGLTVSIGLIDELRAVYSATWSASTIGNYQLYVKNNSTYVIFISDNVIIKTDSELDTNVYIGL